MKCIPHPYWIYTKCFSTLICYGWAYGLTLITVMPMQVWGGFLRDWGRPEPDQCCNVTVEAQPHPWSASYIHNEFIQSVLAPLCYEWAYGLTLTLLRPCRLGVDFGNIGVDLSLPEWCWYVMVDAPNPPWSASHIHIEFIHSVLAH